MSTSQLFAVHVLVFSVAPVMLALRPWRLAQPLLYAYVAVIGLVGGFLGSLYSLPVHGLPVVGSVVVPGNALAFGALVFTVLVLLFTTKDPQVVRDVVQVMVLMTAFRMAFVLLATTSLQAEGILNPFDTSAELLDESFGAVAIDGGLHIAELLVLVVACERIKAWRRSVPLHYAWYVVAYVSVLVIDGALHQLLVVGETDPAGGDVRSGIRASVVLAMAYAVPVTAYLVVFRDRVARYEAVPIPMRDLVRAPNTVLVREIERQHRELAHQATHDALTGLANRTELVRRADETLGRLGRDGGCLAMLFIDLDDFKLVNDGHGHAAGDTVLIEVAGRIESCLRDRDVAARLGGDEFCVLLTDLTDSDAAVTVGIRILHELSKPVPLTPRATGSATSSTATVHASVGLAFASGRDPTSADLLIRNADLAMYRAKELGKDRIVVFSDELDHRARSRAALTAEIARGVDAGEFVAHYQPVVELDSGRIVGVEALVRWHHPERGLLLPDDFIVQAELHTALLDLGAQILEQACADAARWRRERGQGIRVNVNVSTRQLNDPHFVAVVAGALRRAELPPELLALEITESTLMSDVHRTVRAVEQMKVLGVRIAIDDFGTGFSSLAHLHRFPVDVLKVDKSFVDRVCDAGIPTGGPLVQSIVGLGRLLDLDVVAEGIESEPQRAALVEMGCRFGQGFHFSPAVTADEIGALLGGDPRVGDGVRADSLEGHR